MKILATLCMLLLSAVVQADTRTPDQVVTETAETLARRIDGQQARLSANPAELYKLVDEVFLPVFDTDYAGRLVLGRDVFARVTVGVGRQPRELGATGDDEEDRLVAAGGGGIAGALRSVAEVLGRQG